MKNLAERTAALFLSLVLALSLAACGEKETLPAEAGEKTFELVVTDLEGKSENFTVTSAAATVGDALLDEGLIEGEEGPYGLYIKTVNGITADYETDGHYWAFYIGGEYASAGVDQTEIEDGVTYTLKVE